MSSVTIEKPQNIKLDDTQFKTFLENVIWDMDSFDVHLLNKYYETKDIPLSEMTDI